MLNDDFLDDLLGDDGDDDFLNDLLVETVDSVDNINSVENVDSVESIDNIDNVNNIDSIDNDFLNDFLSDSVSVETVDTDVIPDSVSVGSIDSDVIPDSVVGSVDTDNIDDDFVGYDDFIDDNDDDIDDDFVAVNFNEVLENGIDIGASDINLYAGYPVYYDVRGSKVYDTSFGVLDSENIKKFYLNITSYANHASYNDDFMLDVSYVLDSGRYRGRRFRVAVGMTDNRQVSMTFRVITDKLPSLDDMNVPDVIKKYCLMSKGLVLVNGPTGSGKSTLLASMLDYARKRRSVKILTVEKPVEYVHSKDVVHGQGVVHQLEVGRDARSFSSALDLFMRSKPDVILIGEVRNEVELDALLQASESGHLAFSTMHTNSASEAIDRISTIYKGSEQARVLNSFGHSCRAIINQVLVKRKDGSGLFAVREILPVNKEVRLLIGNADSQGIRDYQFKHGITMEHELARAVINNECSYVDAMRCASEVDDFDAILNSMGFTDTYVEL